MDFGVSVVKVVYIGGVEVWITETTVNTWILMAVLILFAAGVRLGMKRFKTIPTGLQNMVELAVETLGKFIQNNSNERIVRSGIGGWFFMVFSFILLSNLSGTVGIRPPTADFSVTFAFAFATFVLIQYVGFTYGGFKYLKSFFEPHPLFLPLNIIGELARPISLSFRLFGNALVGMILMTMLYTLPPVFVRIALPVPLHLYFDVIIGLLQTYIFCSLSLSFIGSVIPDGS